MDIDEAIKENKEWLKEHPHLGAVEGYKPIPPYEAIQLGIEALERVNHLKGKTLNYLRITGILNKRLPSETEKPEEKHSNQNGWFCSVMVEINGGYFCEGDKCL